MLTQVKFVVPPINQHQHELALILEELFATKIEREREIREGEERLSESRISLRKTHGGYDSG